MFWIVCDPSCVCVCVCVRGPLDRAYTHHWFKITLPNTDQAHDKHL